MYLSIYILLSIDLSISTIIEKYPERSDLVVGGKVAPERGHVLERQRARILERTHVDNIKTYNADRVHDRAHPATHRPENSLFRTGVLHESEERVFDGTADPHVKTKSMVLRPLIYLDRPPPKQWLLVV